jgi:hypothetical protein
VLAAQAARNAAANEGDLVTARTRLAEAESGITRLENARQQLLDLADEAVVSSCFEQRELAITLVSQANDSLTSLRRNIGLAKSAIKQYEDAVKAEESAARENNAGTGVPGSAGQGPGATPSPAPSPTTIDTGDGLEEVQVTGKRNPTLISGDPAIPDQVAVDVPEPNLDIQTDNTNRGLSGATDQARAQATIQDTVNFQLQEDWRVRLQLSPDADYLYKADDPGILLPLQQTNGIIFPYTPTIQVQYAANYEPVDLVHSNYKVFQYRNSGVDTVSITCDFTAQDTAEANYLLAVIHFFRSVTKMFYGQDEQPKPGTPPPLCYLFGLGDFQFNAHPLAISNFTYNLHNNVDYIRASNTTTSPGVSKESAAPRDNTSQASKARRDQSSTKIGAGGNPQPTQWNGSRTPAGSVQPTYVPTKITISLTAVPVVSRLDISTRFSLKDYATGNLLRGVQNSKGGIW